MAQLSDITFIHCWSFEINTLFSLRDSETFSTAYNTAVYEWNLSIIREDGFVFRNLANRNRRRDVELSIEPSFRSLHMRTPTVSKCEFKVVFKDQFTDQVLLSPAPHVAVSSMDEDMTTFTVPMQSSLGTLVSQIFNSPEYRGQTCEISTKLVLPASAFEADEWTNYAPPTPVELDFRFTHIYDESHHDFTIRTRGGVAYRASRAALFLCSSYFRNLFPFPNEEVVDFSYECVSTVVMFMITGTFSAPPSLTPQLTKEIVNCAERFSAINRKKLVNALAKMASNELVDHRDDIDAVVSWLLVASECEMQRLQNACSALLITIHYNQLVHDYSMAASSPALAEVRQRLHLRHGMFRPAPYTRLIQLKRGMFNVRTLMNLQSEEEISK